jgi:hypothetical protein
VAAPAYGDRVFLNVPFDRRYRALFDALVFAVHDCGYVARCALEGDDGSVVRLDKIFAIMAECRFGIHDLSRTTLDRANRLPRFNMPLELGVFLGAKRFGNAKQRTKTCLILDRDPYRYQVFCSDISGQDIRAHNNDGPLAIKLVRDWLRTSRKSASTNIPGGARVTQRYWQFRSDLPDMCVSAGLEVGSLIFLDYRTLVVAWLQGNPW